MAISIFGTRLKNTFRLSQKVFFFVETKNDSNRVCVAGAEAAASRKVILIFALL